MGGNLSDSFSLNLTTWWWLSSAVNITTWRCKGAEFSSCSSQGSPGLDCCCRVQLNGTFWLPLFSACKISALGEFKPSLYLTQFESKEETFFCTDQLHLSWRNMIQSKLKHMNHMLSITAVFEFFCLKRIFLRKLWLFFSLGVRRKQKSDLLFSNAF